LPRAARWVERRASRHIGRIDDMETVQSLWIGPELSPFEFLCIQSFLAHGHAFDLYVYGEVANVPAGCNLRDARTILGEDRVFVHHQGDERGSVAGFSDLFRYKLLQDRGGWWVDTDVVCLVDRLPDVAVALAREDETQVNGAILKFPPGHPAMTYAYARASDIGTSMTWGAIGPVLLTQLVARFDLGHALAATRSFYPIHYSESDMLIDPERCLEVTERTRDATFLHLWNEIFRRAGYDKRLRPPRGSYLHGLMASHGMHDAFGAEYRLVVADGARQLRPFPLR
jgi:hypothetical protein